MATTLASHGRNHCVDSQSLECTVLRVVYQEPAFSVVRVQVAGQAEPVTCVGALGQARAGDVLQLTGAWQSHPVHGRQFRVQQATPSLPRTALGVTRYL